MNLRIDASQSPPAVYKGDAAEPMSNVTKVHWTTIDDNTLATVEGEGYIIRDQPATLEGSRKKEAALPGDVDVTPAAAELAAKEGVDLTAISGTGKGGRIIADDVKAVVGE